MVLNPQRAGDAGDDINCDFKEDLFEGSKAELTYFHTHTSCDAGDNIYSSFNLIGI